MGMGLYSMRTETHSIEMSLHSAIMNRHSIEIQLYSMGMEDHSIRMSLQYSIIMTLLSIGMELSNTKTSLLSIKIISTRITLNISRMDQYSTRIEVLSLLTPLNGIKATILPTLRVSLKGRLLATPKPHLQYHWHTLTM